MTPTLRPHSLVWIDERSSMRGQLCRGDIVAARPAALDGRACVKRVAGLPGEWVTCDERTWQLEHDEYFLLGDRADDSLDSRRLGPIPRHELIGRVTVHCWPLPIRRIDPSGPRTPSSCRPSVLAMASVTR